MAAEMLVAAIDAGSPARMGWAYRPVGAGPIASGHGEGDGEELLDALVLALRNGSPVALGIEAPLWFPAGRDYARMTAARGELERATRRPWSAGAGCASMAAGLANLTWVLEGLARRVGRVQTTTRAAENGSHSRLMIWEAFVTGSRKSEYKTHYGDALVAVEAFAGQWPNLTEWLTAPRAVNLAGAVALATGHDLDVQELGRPVTLVTHADFQHEPD